MVKKVKEIYLFLQKGYKYEDELGSKKIQQPFPGNAVRKLVGIS
jgi:hypothetical protein